MLAILRNDVTQTGVCIGGLHYSNGGTVNLSSVNITNCYALCCPCVSVGDPRNNKISTVGLTAKFLNVIHNFGEGGFYAASEVGLYGWYLYDSNFYGNEITIGILLQFQGIGMNVDSCVFSGNKVITNLRDKFN
jgi:hypothetical protein